MLAGAGVAVRGEDGAQLAGGAVQTTLHLVGSRVQIGGDHERVPRLAGVAECKLLVAAEPGPRIAGATRALPGPTADTATVRRPAAHRRPRCTRSMDRAPVSHRSAGDITGCATTLRAKGSLRQWLRGT